MEPLDGAPGDLVSAAEIVTVSFNILYLFTICIPLTIQAEMSLGEGAVNVWISIFLSKYKVLSLDGHTVTKFQL